MIRLVTLVLLATIFTAACTTVGPLVDGEGGAPGRLVIKNQSSSAIGAVLLSRCGGFSVGPNRLDSSAEIPVGSEKVFEISPGCWDVDIAGGGGQTAGRFTIVPEKDYVLDFK